MVVFTRIFLVAVINCYNFLARKMSPFALMFGFYVHNNINNNVMVIFYYNLTNKIVILLLMQFFCIDQLYGKLLKKL